MKIYVTTVDDNEITVSLNGEAAVTKTVKPTITALANRNFRFECDGIDEEVESYLDIFINGQALKGSWLSDEEWLSVALFDAIMNKTFVSGEASPGGSSYLVYKALISQIGTNAPTVVSNGSGANTPFVNTLGGDITFAYGSEGYFEVNSTVPLPVEKTAVIMVQSYGDTLTACGNNENDVPSTQLFITTRIPATNAPVNGRLANAYFEIQLYP